MKTIKRLALVLIGLFLLQSILFSQEKQVRGYVYNTYTKVPVAGVKVLEQKFGHVTSTDSSGFFQFAKPGKSRVFIFSHSDFFDLKYRHRIGSPGRNDLRILLKPMNHKTSDTLWRNYKNAISYAPLELMSGALGVRYERFLKQRQSVGLHSSIYLFGFNNFFFDLGANPARFQGIKLSPFYRFYPARSNSHAFFLEGKIPIGYFDFNELTYRYSSTSYGKNFPQQFWTIGGSLALGWMFRLSKGNHGFANLSIGLQYFPMEAPNEMEGNFYGDTVTYHIEDNWWYITSSGAVLDIKFTIGGLF